MGVFAALLAAALAVLSALLLLPAPERRLAKVRGDAVAGQPQPETGRPGRPVRPGRPEGARRPVAGLRLVATAGGGLAVLLVVPGVAGLGVAAAVGLAVWVRSDHWESGAVRRRRARIEAELPHVVDLMTAAMAAGTAPTTALSLVAKAVDGPTGEELRPWVTRLALGTDPVAVWASMARHPQLGRLGVTLLRSAESGAPVAAALLRLSEDLRARRRAAVEERVRQVEVRAAVPLGVCLLPAFVLVGVVPLVAGSVSGLLAGR